MVPAGGEAVEAIRSSKEPGPEPARAILERLPERNGYAARAKSS